LLARNHPGHSPPLTDENLGRLNITLDVTINLKRAPANDLESLANDLEIVTYDRLLSA